MGVSLQIRKGFVTALLLVSFVLQGPVSVLAGTTGAVNGTVVDPQSNKPIAGAAITAQSPSQSARTTSDAAGRFSFISLAPDTYSVSVAATAAYDAAVINGVTVQADQTLTVTLQQSLKLKVIGSVTSRAASALVKPGTTADVYSINAVTQDKTSVAGGGGSLNSAWSSIATVPGVFVAAGQAGYIGSGSTNGATVSIRGGDYNQIGYELDGIPVNRAFDNYPSGSVSSLGQQELQVYTGATPANAEGEGLSGYINQVIRTGTAPASRNLSLGIGAPTFYNKVSFEAGGANPGRTFSYYLGAGAYNQGYRYYDNYNGASLQPLWGAPLAPCPSAAPIGCHGPNGEDYTNGGRTPAFALGPYVANAGSISPQNLAAARVRDTVANFHFGIPRKDGSKDDVQLLFDDNFIDNQGYTSTNDIGGAAFLDSIGATHSYVDGYNFTGQPVGTLLPPGYSGGGVSNYYFPGSPVGRPRNADIEPDRRDAITNNQSIVKLQYQRNFGTSAFLRVYGYTYYSNFFQLGPQTQNMNYVGYSASDYNLSSHSRGVSVQFSDQVNPQHLLSVQGNYTTSTTLRANNSGIGKTGNVGWLVSSADPTSGICYSPTGAPVVGCGSASQTFTLKQGVNGTVVPANTVNGGVCGAGTCQYILGENGVSATYNTVTPRFTALSLTDQWKPTDRLNLNFGLRYDGFEFIGGDTTGSPARTLWYNAWNLTHPANLQLAPNPGAGQVESYSVLQPRFGMTYTVDPRTVLRASYGRYVQAPNSAFEQYNFLQQNDAANLARFGAFGLPTTPGHPVRPEISNNYDVSYEHQFRGDTSLKLTPFLRKTQDQIQNFYLDQKTGFQSGLNVGRQTSQGVELEVDKGDFSRNGLAARLSFTYTNSYINYTKLGNGGTIIDGFNANIAQYNGFTKAGGGAPCYTTAAKNKTSAPDPTGVADPTCAPGSIANPYYNAPIQPLMDVNGKYATYNTFPGGVGGGNYSSLSAPFVSSLVLQWKRGPLAITPAIQFEGGIRYGVPLSTPGIDPRACAGGLSGSTTGDPRYPYGGAGGAPFDASIDAAGNPTCGSNFAIPNVYTGRFDNVGAFVAPNQLLLHTQITYDVNKRITLVGNFANIINRCWGGTKVPFAINHACNYVATYGATSGPVPFGNQFNPGDRLQPFLATPYDPMFPNFPFNMFVEARIKI